MVKFPVGIILLCMSLESVSQVPVREEPRHHPVLSNEYIRLLDVWIPPGDTTLFHIHATPSVFLIFTNTKVATQLKDSVWLNDVNIKGEVYFEEFTRERVHRVSNADRDTFHVTDIEILSPYKPNDRRKPLPFGMLFDNERAFAYRITNMDTAKQFESRGPILVALVEGVNVYVNEVGQKKQTEITPGKFAYLKPGGSFQITAKNKGTVNLVLFEIK